MVTVSPTDEYLSTLNSDQLDKVYVALQRKTKEVEKLMGRKLVEENRADYLRSWAALAQLPSNMCEYFIEHANIDDFILENGYYHYMSRYGAPMTFQVWSCRWLLEKRGDYVSFHKRHDGRKLALKYRDEACSEPAQNLTEYVIYKAVEKDPYILRITDQNKLFAGQINRHFAQLDKIKR